MNLISWSSLLLALALGKEGAEVTGRKQVIQPVETCPYQFRYKEMDLSDTYDDGDCEFDPLNIPPNCRPGTMGKKGPKGEVGNEGFQGTIGQAGVQGPVGSTGARGPNGPAGPRGIPGIEGSSGGQGAEGQMGPFGVQGPIGDQGPVGPAGPAGIPGPAGPISEPQVEATIEAYSYQYRANPAVVEGPIQPFREIELNMDGPISNMIREDIYGITVLQTGTYQVTFHITAFGPATIAITKNHLQQFPFTFSIEPNDGQPTTISGLAILDLVNSDRVGLMNVGSTDLILATSSNPLEAIVNVNMSVEKYAT